MLQIPQIKALDGLYTELKTELPEPLFDKVINVHFDIIERFRIQMEITEFLTAKMVRMADKLLGE
ncbi:hypothetical protein [Runella aurantiaca]|uniref:Uncharacterized protein n=1 Tax=Runella aurantiaca TaxID=2282308 RepID=A0A369IGJ2_9BACT|nr:hypothetical protein [Runella aurantiaca]RDB06533.1 hypothetical protein DVG78_07250 [Runella aurantiaca]